MTDEFDAFDEPQTDPVEAATEPDLPEAEVPVARPTSALDDEEFETPSGRYLGLFGVVGAVVGIAVGIQQGSVAFGMAIGLAIGVGVGLILNTYTGR